MQTHLMRSRKFAPLFWTQFLTAFNDNFLKQTLIFVILAQMAAQGAALVTLAGGIFIVPFLLLSAIAGELADKYDKAKIAELLKRCELVVAAISVSGPIDRIGRRPGARWAADLLSAAEALARRL